MKEVKTLDTNTLKDPMKKDGYDERQTFCQSTYETSYMIGNQICENSNR